MVIVTRNIHPVGQGGLACETHGENEKLYVYDCGVLPKSSQAKTIALTHLPEISNVSIGQNVLLKKFTISNMRAEAAFERTSQYFCHGQFVATCVNL